ncbi:hypothetical protein SODALDRAFT_333550 [Sodiomyces alkalinus F11]|uniref:Uncharacterized protein n=1 Tax=Sodiomyces alkalinus (strain CBS 110278 / VKM F-3762 / F11) TaxID=1314773 RepID=A0A3N2PTE8_SODAK|nr:hypothetical protein SODALDRAFT_333550 [Sodiomyces alkalinus F11]ROT37795.1 hypothetical protein SODALDRAFT_333550 [Sodiomyces alkalinus F11]
MFPSFWSTRFGRNAPDNRLPTLPIELRANIARQYVNRLRSELVWNDDGDATNQFLPPLRHMRRPIYPHTEWWVPPHGRIIDGADLRDHPNDNTLPNRVENDPLRREVMTHLNPLLRTNREMREHTVRSFWEDTWVNVEITSGRHGTRFRELADGTQIAIPVFTAGSDSRMGRLVHRLADPVVESTAPVPTTSPYTTLGEHIRRLSIRFEHGLPPYSGRQDEVGPWDLPMLRECMQELVRLTPNVRRLELFFDTNDTLQYMTENGVLDIVTQILDQRIARRERVFLRSIVIRGGDCRALILAWRRRYPGLRIDGLMWNVNPYLIIHYRDRWISNNLPRPDAPPRWVRDDEEVLEEEG